MTVNEKYDIRVVENIEMLQQVLSVAPIHPIPNQCNNLKLFIVPLLDFKNAKGDDIQNFLHTFESMSYTHDQCQ